MKRFLSTLLIATSLLFSCVERGKSIKDEATTKAITEEKKSTVAHYTCPKGHKGSDQQGKCPECGSVYQHNQLFHSNGTLTLPQNNVKDPFNANAASTNNAPAPAQNAYGDFHYTCPEGHSGGAGTASNCVTCNTKLTHNQGYHK